MFRRIKFGIALFTAVTCSGAITAQDRSEKPTEILPDRVEALPVQPAQKSVDDIVVDVPLVLGNADPAGADAFIIGAVQIEGTSSLSQADFSSAIEPYIGRSAKPDELRSLARSVADRARENGYLFASALVPAQSVNVGVLKVRLDEGVIHTVKIEGTANRFVKRLFAGLINKPAKRDAVERAILLSQDLYGFSMQSAKFARKSGKGVLVINLIRKAHELNATLDNYGRFGDQPVRGRLELDRGGVFGDRDWIHAQALTTPGDPGSLLFVSGRYSSMIGDSGEVLSIMGGAGKTRQVYDDGGWSKSRSRFVGLKLTRPVVRTNSSSIWLGVEATKLSVDRVFSDTSPRRDDIATITVSTNGNFRFAGGRVSGGLSATQGLDIWGATRANDPNASRRDASGQFTKGEMWVNWNRRLGNGFSLRTVVNAQLASRPLLSSQEFDLGGPRIGRGFNYSEKSGDQGVSGLAELRRYFDQPAKGISSVQLYTYVDGGYVHNLRRTNGGSSLASAGAGIRAKIGKMELAMELAKPVKGMRDQGTSPRLNLALGFSF